MTTVRLPAFALLLAACSDYEFAKPNSSNLDSGDDPETGEARQHDWTPDTGLADTALPDTGTPADTGSPPADSSPPPDACYEPEDGYEENPAARILTDDGTTPVTVTFVYSDTSYNDELWLDSPSSAQLARSWADSPGLSYTLGPYAKGTEVVFGLEVQNTGDHWENGHSSRNADHVVHGAITYEGNCSWLIGFEDLYGGGDEDYNDLVFRVQGMLRQEQ